MKAARSGDVSECMETERTRYREWSPWPTFTTVILWIVVPIAVYAILTDATEIPSEVVRWLVALSVIGLTWAIWAFLGGLTVLVQEPGDVPDFPHLTVLGSRRAVVSGPEFRLSSSLRHGALPPKCRQKKRRF